MLPKALYDKGSLTDKLRAAAKHSFSVQVISEEFIWIQPKDAPLLALSAAQNVWCRHVYLWVDDAIWVEAKTIIAEKSFQHSAVEALKYIQNQSLGQALFACPNLTRSPFEVNQTTRSSIFLFHGEPILVSETFLPEALNYFRR